MDYEVEAGNLSDRVKRELGVITKVGFDPWVYDTDGDCYISFSEANAAVHDCYMEVITEAQRDEVVALWESGTKNPACELPPPPFAPWDYDTDGDCYISMSEANAAVHDCYMGVITEAQRDEVVALWENGIWNPACSKTWEWIKDHWKWIAGGVGAAVAIGVGITIAKRR